MRVGLKIGIADRLARLALRVPALERAVVAACRQPNWRRRSGLGAIAVSYTRVLSRPELRTVDFHTYKLRVNIAEELGTGPYFFLDDGTLWFAGSLVQPGDACVDAGANIGHYAFLMASRAGPSGKVLAFEANPRFVELLGETVLLNGYSDRMEVRSEALWDRSGEEKEFFISTNSANSGTSSLVDHGVYIDRQHTIRTTTISLDDAARQAGIDKFRLVKIDVERAEEFVLAGASNLLARQRVDYVLVELWSGSVAERILVGHGYRGWHARPSTRTFVPIESVPAHTFGDFLFCAPGKDLPATFARGLAPLRALRYP